KKIIIDEDWKSQVEAEREAAARAKEAASVEKAAGAESQADAMVWPEPSLPLLVTTLATQAMAAMGLIPNQGAQITRDLPQAKHFIDTIGLLEEKTKGNCSAEEADMFENVLYELRMAFVAVKEKK
ncbi:MAG TPA: DUF1844 domain-containing protein, partial [Planctomycetaceae bacterium]|nr:DUF1844 domain-containing protein [Planctomycetaceae bacterium]